VAAEIEAGLWKMGYCSSVAKSKTRACSSKFCESPRRVSAHVVRLFSKLAPDRCALPRLNAVCAQDEVMHKAPGRRISAPIKGIGWWHAGD
jgi:hypothetical protein